jgi:hypothetical protein
MTTKFCIYFFAFEHPERYSCLISNPFEKFEKTPSLKGNLQVLPNNHKIGHVPNTLLQYLGLLLLCC